LPKSLERSLSIFFCAAQINTHDHKLVRWTINFSHYLGSISSTLYVHVFVRIFQQRQNVTRKTTFVRKICMYNVDEIDTWGQFHPNFTQSFYVRKSQKRKKYSQAVSLFCTLWICVHKSFVVSEINPRTNF